MKSVALTTIIFAILALTGCASGPAPAPIEGDYLDRARTSVADELTVSASVLSEAECREILGLDLYKHDIQPIWIEISNNGKEPAWLLPVGTDPQYLTAMEVAEIFHGWSRASNEELDLRLSELRLNTFVGPGGKQSGYLFTNLDHGTKSFNVDLLTADGEFHSTMFFITVPGIVTDHSLVDFASLYSEDEIIDVDEAGLMAAIAEMPCCTSNAAGTKFGDPLNLVVIGGDNNAFKAFKRAGWDETETTSTDSAFRTIQSFLFGNRYRYSPVSSLYVFGRKQDIAIQKARGSINERNHARFWMTPYRFRGHPVFIGQISRDIGVRFTWSTITTHKIDPDVDETRTFMLQDMWYSQGLRAYAMAEGVGSSTRDAPGHNLTGDPYFTDGFRAILWLSGEPVELDDIVYYEWLNNPPDSGTQAGATIPQDNNEQ